MLFIRNIPELILHNSGIRERVTCGSLSPVQGLAQIADNVDHLRHWQSHPIEQRIAFNEFFGPPPGEVIDVEVIEAHPDDCFWPDNTPDDDIPF